MYALIRRTFLLTLCHTTARKGNTAQRTDVIYQQIQTTTKEFTQIHFGSDRRIARCQQANQGSRGRVFAPNNNRLQMNSDNEKDI